VSAGLPVAEFAFPGPARERLLAAILDGRKTATTALHEEHVRRGERIPSRGERSVAVDSAARPVAVLETTEVRVIPIGTVDEAFARDEGEGFASVAAWRAAHEAFFRSDAMCAALGEPPVEVRDDTLVVCERFRVVERLAPLPVASSPVPAALGPFELVATDGVRVHARLAGRAPHARLRVASRLAYEEGGDAAAARAAFARAFAAVAPADGDLLVVETPETAPWREALEAAGFVARLRKVFVKRRLDDDLPAAPGSWRFRSLAEVGDRAFSARMGEASEGDPFEERQGAARDLDREWRELTESAGARLDRTRWLLVDDDDGPVGVVLPQAIGEDTGTLYYVAVLPERRGAGLGTKLHALGLRLLASHGLRRYVGSTDVRNAPMRAVFERNGARVTGTEAYYRPSRSPPPPASP
jgi:uncharacterized protein YhfF/RimJ/RimL family protein N-acetyltransferase